MAPPIARPVPTGPTAGMRNICLQGIVHPFILYHTITSSFCQYFFRNFYFFLWKRPWRDPPPRRKAPLARISAKEEDLGETRLLRRGRSLQTSPGETFPGASPPFYAYCIANAVAGGSAPGNLFWVRQSFYCLRIGADGRDTPGDGESFDVCFAGGHKQWPSGGKFPIAGQNGMLAVLLPAAFAIRGAGIGSAGCGQEPFPMTNMLSRNCITVPSRNRITAFPQISITLPCNIPCLKGLHRYRHRAASVRRRKKHPPTPKIPGASSRGTPFFHTVCVKWRSAPGRSRQGAPRDRPLRGRRGSPRSSISRDW